MSNRQRKSEQALYMRLISGGAAFGAVIFICLKTKVPLLSVADGSALKYLLVFGLGFFASLAIYTRTGFSLARPGCLVDIALLERPTEVDDADSQFEPDEDSVLARMQRAIAAFPDRYPDYQTRPPKLNDDVRPWLKETGLAKNEAEARVFGTIIAENLHLSPDTLKGQ